MRHGVWQINFFVALDCFLPFYPPKNLKNQNFEKLKKIIGDIIILHKCTKNHDHMIFCSLDMVHNRCNCYFSFWVFFFNCYFTALRPTSGHSQGDSLTNPMLITVFAHIRPEGHREPRNKVGSLSPVERLAGFEPETFQFLLQRLNPLGHSPFALPPP